MKKLKFLFVLLIGILIIPCSALVVNAAESENDPVNIYFFYGDGCPHCAEAEEFFDSIEDEYGDMYNIVSYETWSNDDNVELMNEVAEVRGEEPEGVPYIIIGNHSWDGYSSSLDNEIIEKIEAEYETPTDERYDIMNYVDISSVESSSESYAGDIAVVIAIVLVVAGVSLGIWYARRKAA